jgi:hypothetical protein
LIADTVSALFYPTLAAHLVFGHSVTVLELSILEMTAQELQGNPKRVCDNDYQAWLLLHTAAVEGAVLSNSMLLHNISMWAMIDHKLMIS